MTPRALRMLQEADLIAAEDTRHTLQLLNHFNIKGRLVRYDEHSKDKQGEYLLGQLLEGKNVALEQHFLGVMIESFCYNNTMALMGRRRFYASSKC